MSRRSARRVLTLGAFITLAHAGLAPAGALGAGIGGVVPDLPTGAHPRVHVAARAGVLQYDGGPVLHSNRTHLIFWQPGRSGLSFDPGYTALFARFLTGVAADSHLPSNVYGLSGQYTDAGGPAAYASSYGGSVMDVDALPASGCVEPASGPVGWRACLTDTQLQRELERVVAVDGLPRTGLDIYFLVLPDRLATCTDSSSESCALGGSATGYCGYHSQTAGGLLYAVIPYNAVPGHCQSGSPRPNGSAADPALSTLSHEHNETITDPLTYNSWLDAAGNEEGDLCITSFGAARGGSRDSAWNEVVGGGHYWLQEEWSNEDGSCQPRDEVDPVSFGAPERVAAGSLVTLDARAVDPDGRIVAYTWFFGDGGISHRRLARHRFVRAGSNRVVLRVTDRSGNWGFAVRVVRVRPAAMRHRHGRPGSLRRGRRGITLP